MSDYGDLAATPPGSWLLKRRPRPTKPATLTRFALPTPYDLESVAESLGPTITAQTEWPGDAERRYEVEVITDTAP
ncbi:hypothetical protein A5740_06705 [Mycobacterium sp. GA-1841]|uniref:hypothetical protein n=1 Tax=Mycobacterium sp. GA-1841 TaxID=1834154 RepID=UPI00096CDEF1|nr:hypothetical protein [Mycobacterium sp. GA-1841]OMC35884.1 hypothetical protein A5740_06705 [Mycobacterium sp. GA-1841]